MWMFFIKGKQILYHLLSKKKRLSRSLTSKTFPAVILHGLSHLSCFFLPAKGTKFRYWRRNVWSFYLIVYQCSLQRVQRDIEFDEALDWQHDTSTLEYWYVCQYTMERVRKCGSGGNLRSHRRSLSCWYFMVGWRDFSRLRPDEYGATFFETIFCGRPTWSLVYFIPGSAKFSSFRLLTRKADNYVGITWGHHPPDPSLKLCCC